uniref:EGF-like domain-containing protein n=1 Tax=Acrobeloides nanus TaxID=290746 RepID=A0A914C8E0_9BILA
MVNPCLPDLQNRTLHTCVHGRCVNPIVIKQQSGREVTTHECDCFEGFEGPQCSHVIEKHHALALGYILGPVAAILLVLCLLGCMLFLFVARNKRANQGTYSPSTQEMTGAARNQMPVIHKVPLQERLI